MILKNNYMEELKKYFPVITKGFYMNTKGEEFRDKDDTSENFKKIKEYEKVNYFGIFNK